MKKLVALTCIIVGFTACSKNDETTNSKDIKPVTCDAPAGTYKLDKTHASLIFKLNHLGLSNYTARFKHFDSELKLDPANPINSSVTAIVDSTSLETDYPNNTGLDFNAELQNDKWLDTNAFPKITFTSKSIELTSPNSAKITGELNLHGITKKIILDATFNGGYAANPMDPMGSRIGFSAHGSLKRSEFGVKTGIPQDGSKMGVGDDVEIIIEAEFTKVREDNNNAENENT